MYVVFGILRNGGLDAGVIGNEHIGRGWKSNYRHLEGIEWVNVEDGVYLMMGVTMCYRRRSWLPLWL